MMETTFNINYMLLIGRELEKAMFDGNGKCGCGIDYVKRCDYIVCFAPLCPTLLL
jgi:hypothetical protein